MATTSCTCDTNPCQCTDAISEQALCDAAQDAVTMSRFANDVSPAWITRRTGTQIKNIAKLIEDFQAQVDAAFAATGYLPPETFASGLTASSGRFTVEHNGNVYAAKPSAVPFTTTASFDDSQWYLVNEARIDVATPAAFAAIAPADGQLVRTKGRLTISDGGHGDYIYDSSSTATDDGGFVIDAGGGGRFLLMDTERANLLQFGGGGDGSTDSSTPLGNCIATGKPVYIPEASSFYLIEDVEIPTMTAGDQTEGLMIVASQRAEIRGVDSATSVMFKMTTGLAFSVDIKGGLWQMASKFFQSTDGFTISKSRFSDMRLEDFGDQVFHVDKFVSCRFEFLEMRNNDGIGIHLTGGGQSNNNHFVGCTWQTCNGKFVQADAGSQSTNMNFIGLQAEDNECDILFDVNLGARSWKITDGYFEECATDYIFSFDGSASGATGRNVRIYDNHFAINEDIKSFVRVTDDVDLHVNDNNFKRVQSIGAAATLSANANASTGQRIVEVHGGNSTIEVKRNSFSERLGANSGLDRAEIAFDIRTEGPSYIFEPDSVDGNTLEKAVAGGGGTEEVLGYGYKIFDVTLTADTVIKLKHHYTGQDWVFRANGAGHALTFQNNSGTAATELSSKGPGTNEYCRVTDVGGTLIVHWLN